MIVQQLKLSWFVDQLKNGEPFTFVRYGDGEWLTILGFYGKRNSNGCTFTRELSNDMRVVLKQNNPYHHAILKIAKREREVPYKNGWHPYGGPVIQKWLIHNNISVPWYDGDEMLEKSLEGKIFPLVEQLREKRILYIGNKRLRGLNMRGIGFFPYCAYVQPPPQNAHTVKDALLRQIFKAIERNKIDLIGWSAGLAKIPMINEVWLKYPEITNIDFGSLFDGYFEPAKHVTDQGLSHSRGYIRKGGHDWDALLKANTGQ